MLIGVVLPPLCYRLPLVLQDPELLCLLVRLAVRMLMAVVLPPLCCRLPLVLQDPVAAEEDDKEASPEGLSPPREPLPSPSAEPPAVGVEPPAAAASTAPLEVRRENCCEAVTGRARERKRETDGCS